MEAYEYKNYTSKQVVFYRTDKCRNIPKQSLKVLQLMYKTSYHSHTDERKKFAKKADEQITRRINLDNNDAKVYVHEAVLEQQPHASQAEPPANN